MTIPTVGRVHQLAPVHLPGLHPLPRGQRYELRRGMGQHPVRTVRAPGGVRQRRGGGHQGGARAVQDKSV